MSEETEAKYDFTTLRLPYEIGEWRDCDDRMFDACFTILGQFVEDELEPESEIRKVEDFEEGDYTFYRGYRVERCEGTDEKAIDLWIWYKTELPELERDYQDSLNDWSSSDGAIPRRYERDFVESLKTRKLAELMEIRRALWT